MSFGLSESKASRSNLLPLHDALWGISKLSSSGDFLSPVKRPDPAKSVSAPHDKRKIDMVLIMLSINKSNGDI